MWKINRRRAYPFRQSHRNLFPPEERPLSDVEEEEEDVPIVCALEDAKIDGRDLNQGKVSLRSTDTIDSSEFMNAKGRGYHSLDQVAVSSFNGLKKLSKAPEVAKPYQSSPGPYTNVPSRLKNQLKPTVNRTRVPVAQVRYPIFNPPTAQLPPFMFPVRDTSHSPVATVTRLLQDVLGVMDMIMSEQGRVEEESQILLELVELAAIMQDEAEALVELVDLVDEYTEEADTVAGLEEWMQDLVRIQTPSPVKVRHRRDDSGVSMGERANYELCTPKDRDAVHEELRKVRQVIEETPEETPIERIAERMRVSRLPTHRPRKLKKKRELREAQFRDSALDLQSPVVKRSLSNRSLRWL